MAKIKVTGSFNGITTKRDGVCDVKFKFPFSEIGSYSAFLVTIGEECKCQIEVEGNNYVIPTAKFKTLKVDNEGEASLVLETYCNNITGIDPINLVQKTITLKVISGANP